MATSCRTGSTVALPLFWMKILEITLSCKISLYNATLLSIYEWGKVEWYKLYIATNKINKMVNINYYCIHLYCWNEGDTYVSKPGLRCALNTPQTGLWSEVVIDCTESYTKHFKGGFSKCPLNLREFFCLYNIRSVYAGVLCLEDVSKLWVPGSY